MAMYEREEDVLGKLNENPYMNITELSKATQICPSVLVKILNSLCKKGMIEMYRGRDVTFKILYYNKGETHIY